MKDFVPNGTGNSRFLKSVSNFLSLYPTYTDFVNALVAGTLPVDFNGVNSAGYSQLGTPLNKANILTDAVKALLWPSGSAPTDPSINDVLNRLSAGLLYDSGAVKNMLGQLVTLPVSQLDNPVHIATGSYTGTGTYGSANPCSLTFNFTPKVIMLFDSLGVLSSSTNINIYPAIGLTDGLTTDYVRHALWNYYVNDGTTYNASAKKSSDGKTIYWFVADYGYGGTVMGTSGKPLFNESGVVYRYFGLG